jgi:hypothetical protein
MRCCSPESSESVPLGMEEVGLLTDQMLLAHHMSSYQVRLGRGASCNSRVLVFGSFHSKDKIFLGSLRELALLGHCLNSH